MKFAFLRFRSILLVLVFSSIAISACSKAEDTGGASSSGGETSGKTTKVILSHEASEDMTKHKMFLKFKELIEEGSDGEITIEIYPNAQISDDVEALESAQAGDLQIVAPSIGIISNFSKSLQVFDLPFIFKDTESVYEVFDGPVGTELLQELESAGLLGLGFSENGWRHLTTSEGPIVSPDQIQGLKMRTMGVPLHLAFWKEIGANPTPLAFTEVFTALSQGVIDGQENPLQIIYSFKFYESNKYVTTTGHLFDPEPILINKEFFDNLTPENQELFRSAAIEAINYQRDLNSELDQELRKSLEDEGVTITDLTPEQQQEWIEKVKPTYEEYVDEIGKDIVLKVLETAGNESLSEFVSNLK